MVIGGKTRGGEAAEAAEAAVEAALQRRQGSIQGVVNVFREPL